MGSKRKRSAQDTSKAAPAAKKQNKNSGNSAKNPASSPHPQDSSPFLNDPKGDDLKREVQLYDLLASEETAERLNAANAIVSGLLRGQGVEESTLQRHLERRLFRGLASGRKGARLGFSIVLTEILAQLFGLRTFPEEKYAGLTFDKVLGFLIAKTKPDGDLSGQEEKDHSLGLLFGLQSFVRAKVLFGDNQMWNAVLEKLLELANKKPWTREECGWVIVEALGQMNQSHAEYTLDKLYGAALAITPEGVGVWITAKNKFPKMKFPNKPWGQTGNPLDRLQSLAKALKESSSNEASPAEMQQVKQTGNWNAQLHFVWNIVLAQFANAQKIGKSGVTSDFANFWKVAVDENLFSATASRERKFWGFLLFQKVLQDPQSYFPFFRSIFSHNLVRCLINHIQDEERFLHRAAVKSLKVLASTVEMNAYTLVEILPRLIGDNGTYNFDKVTKTKTIEKLLASVNNSNATEVIDILLAPALNVESSDALAEAEMRRTLLGDYILSMVRRVKMTDGSENPSWIGDKCLPTVAKIAYSKHYVCLPPLSDKCRVLFRNRLTSVFAHVLPDLKGFSYPCDLLQSFTPDAVAMDKNITKSKDNAISSMERLLKNAKKAKGEKKAPLQALALLYSLVVFQLYDGEPDAVSILDELKLCYDGLIRRKDSIDSEVDASEVLLELLLSFISKPSALLKRITQHVFSAFMVDITAGGLKLMTDVLQSSESLRGRQELFDQESDDGQEEDDNENAEIDSDVGVMDMNGEEGHLNGYLHEEEDEDEDDEEDENGDDGSTDDDDEEANKLNAALADVLGTHRLDQDSDGNESDSDADMTDSEMMALDSKLVEIFSQRKKGPNKKQEQKDAKETIVNFKTRVLDLLEIYVKKQVTNPLAFGLLLPLLELIRTTTTKQLAGKANNIIQAFAKASKSAKKVEGGAIIQVSEQIKLMKSIHLEASKDPTHMLAKAASTASLLLASSLYRADKENVEKIAKVYKESQVAWVQGEVKMQAAFFIEWVNWCQSHANSQT